MCCLKNPNYHNCDRLQGDWDKALFSLSNRALETLVMVNNNGMEGSISNDGPICSLAQTSLMVLDLYNNSITGEIPECIVNGTSKLQYIRLGAWRSTTQSNIGQQPRMIRV